MSVTEGGVQVCRECGQPLVPQTTKDQPEPPDDRPEALATVEVDVQDVCVNHECGRYGKPNDPFETAP